MRPVAALLLGAVLFATACGAEKQTSAAGVAPKSTIAFVSLARDRETAETRSALILLPGGSAAQRLIDRVSWARVGRSVDVAILGPRTAVAYVLPEDRKAFDKRLDVAGLVHTRIRGWTAFAPRRASLDAARRAEGRLLEAPWYRDAAVAAHSSSQTVLAHRGSKWSVHSAEKGTARRTTPGGGRDEAHPLAAWIPADAVAAAASHDFAAGVRALPFARVIEQGLGLRLGVLARATPGSAVLFVRAGEPFAPLTLVARGGSVRAAERLVHDLDPVAPAPVATTRGGMTLNDVALGPLDLSYGRSRGNLVLTDDPGFTVHPRKTLRPAALPAATAVWLYLDAERGPAALQSLAALAGTSIEPSFVRRLQDLKSVLAYVTHTRTTTSLTVTVDNGQ